MQTASLPDAALAGVETWFGMAFGEGFRRLLATHGGRAVADRVVFYAADALIERNACYQTREYCTGFIAIGDDGGGCAILIAPQLHAPSVFVVDHGDMSLEAFEPLSADLGGWLHRGCPSHNEETAA